MNDFKVGDKLIWTTAEGPELHVTVVFRGKCADFLEVAIDCLPAFTGRTIGVSPSQLRPVPLAEPSEHGTVVAYSYRDTLRKAVRYTTDPQECMPWIDEDGGKFSWEELLELDVKLGEARNSEH